YTFSSHYHLPHPDAHSFPTRRSSDLSSDVLADLSGDGEAYPRSETPADGPAHSARLHPGHLCHDGLWADRGVPDRIVPRQDSLRSEDHTSELQSPCNLVCRLLLEKKN